jgi:hypothetical protein
VALVRAQESWAVSFTTQLFALGPRLGKWQMLRRKPYPTPLTLSEKLLLRLRSMDLELPDKPQTPLHPYTAQQPMRLRTR